MIKEVWRCSSPLASIGTQRLWLDSVWAVCRRLAKHHLTGLQTFDVRKTSMTRDTVTKIATPAVGPALMYSGDAEVSFVARSALNHLPPYAGQAHRG